LKTPPVLQAIQYPLPSSVATIATTWALIGFMIEP